MKVLVLGHRGMLGHVVERRFLELGCETENVSSRWPTEEFKRVILKSDAQFCVNAIGRIPQKTHDFTANAKLPIWLDRNFPGVGVVHPSSDCEWDDSEYGRSKKTASDWIDAHAEKTKRVLTSIVGFEQGGNSSLLGWFLSNPKGSVVSGYTNHFWNGITTLTWANFVYGLMEKWSPAPKVSALCSASCVSKFELLGHFNAVFHAELSVQPKAHGESADKCLSHAVELGPIEEMLEEMKNWY